MSNNSSKSPIKRAYQTCRWRWHNLFADQGIVKINWCHFLSKFNAELNYKIRREIAEKIYQSSDENLRKIAQELRNKGYALLKFSDINIDPEPAFAQMLDLMEVHLKHSDDAGYLDKFSAGKYGGKAMSYSIYEKNDPLETSALMDLAIHPSLIRIATMYLGYYPFLDCISTLYTPIHNSPQFGAQRWHVDTYNKNILKIFFPATSITKDNGPFEFFEPKYSTLKHHKFYPEGMNDQEISEQGLDLNKAITFLAEPGDVLFVDTARCLHRGGCTTKKARFISTAAYCSPFYSFTKSKFPQTLHYTHAFKQHKIDSEQALKKLVSVEEDLFIS